MKEIAASRTSPILPPMGTLRKRTNPMAITKTTMKTAFPFFPMPRLRFCLCLSRLLSRNNRYVHSHFRFPLRLEYQQRSACMHDVDMFVHRFVACLRLYRSIVRKNKKMKGILTSLGDSSTIQSRRYFCTILHKNTSSLFIDIGLCDEERSDPC